MRRRLLGVALGGWLIAAPDPAMALDFSSSMQAHCVGTPGSECSVLQFSLFVDQYQFVGGDTYADITVNSASVASTNSAKWAFGAVQKVWNDTQVLYTDDTNDTDLWTVSYKAYDGFKIKTTSAGGTEVSAPVYLLISMDVFSEGIDNNLRYSAAGWAYEKNGIADPAGYEYSTGTNSVTPEPVSMALLGTGLAGLAGVRRRRRKDMPDA